MKKLSDLLKYNKEIEKKNQGALALRKEAEKFSLDIPDVQPKVQTSFAPKVTMPRDYKQIGQVENVIHKDEFKTKMLQQAQQDEIDSNEVIYSGFKSSLIDEDAYNRKRNTSDNTLPAYGSKKFFLKIQQYYEKEMGRYSSMVPTLDGVEESIYNLYKTNPDALRNGTDEQKAYYNYFEEYDKRKKEYDKIAAEYEWVVELNKGNIMDPQQLEQLQQMQKQQQEQQDKKDNNEVIYNGFKSSFIDENNYNWRRTERDSSLPVYGSKNFFLNRREDLAVQIEREKSMLPQLDGVEESVYNLYKTNPDALRNGTDEQKNYYTYFREYDRRKDRLDTLETEQKQIDEILNKEQERLKEKQNEIDNTKVIYDGFKSSYIDEDAYNRKRNTSDNTWPVYGSKNFFVNMKNELNTQIKTISLELSKLEGAEYVREKNRLDSLNAELDKVLEILDEKVDTKKGILEAQKDKEAYALLHDYYKKDYSANPISILPQARTEEEQARYDRGMAVEGKLALADDKIEAYEYYEKNKDNEYGGGLFGRIGANFKSGTIGEKIAETGANSWKYTTDDIEAARVYQLLDQRLRENNKEAYTDYNNFDTLVSTLSGYAPQFINQAKAEVKGKVAGAVLGFFMGNAVEGARIGGAVMSAADMFKRTVGSQYVELLQNSGMSAQDAKLLATNTALVESAMEFGISYIADKLIFGGNTVAKKLGVEKLVDGTIAILKKAGMSAKGAQIAVNSMKFIGKQAIEGVGEGTEEFLQTGTEIVARKAAEKGETLSAIELLTKTFDFSSYTKEDFAQMKASALAAFIISSGSTGTFKSAISNYMDAVDTVKATEFGKTVKQAKLFEEYTADAVTYCLESENAQVRELAQKVEDAMNNKQEVSDKDIGQLFKYSITSEKHNPFEITGGYVEKELKLQQSKSGLVAVYSKDWDLDADSDSVKVIEGLAKFSNSRIVIEDLDAVEVTDENGQTVYRENMGFVQDGVIHINSKHAKTKLGAMVALHEVTHNIENSDFYDSYKNLAFDILYGGEGTEDYKKAYNEIAERYGDKAKSKEDIDKELVANFTMNKLDEKIINRIAGQNRPLAVRMFNALKTAYNKVKGTITGTEQDLRDIEKALNLFDKALKERRETVDNSNLMPYVDDEGNVRFENGKQSAKRYYLTSDDDNIDSFEITKYNDYIHVQKSVIKKLNEEKFFTDVTEDGSKRRTVINKDSGMEIVISLKGIKETFNENNYKKQPREVKLAKLKLVRSLPDIIENARLVINDKANIHNENSVVKYAYLETQGELDGNPINIKIDIRKTPENNKFWVHRVYFDNKNSGVPAWDKSQAGVLTSAKSMITQTGNKVNTKKQHFLGGETSVVANNKTLAEARRMNLKGEPQAEIFKKTGWYKGIDKKWKKVIDEKDAELFKTDDKQYMQGKEYTYQALVNKSDMPVTILTNEIPMKENNKPDRAKIIHLGYKNARQQKNKNNNDTGTYVYVKDADSNVLVGTDALRHGLERNYEATAKVTMQIGDILKNAIKVNEIKPRGSTAGGYVLLGVGIDSNENFYPTRIVVNKGKVDDIEVLYAVKAQKKSQSPYGAGSVDNSTPLSKGSTITIADFLNVVKDSYADVLSNDVLEKLNIKRPKSVLADSAKYLLGEVVSNETDTKAPEYNSTAKSRDILTRYENDAIRNVAKAMSVSLGTAREYLKPIMQEMSTEYMKTGKLSKETTDRLFEEAYKNGRVINDEAYKEYADLRKYLRVTKIYIDKEFAGDIPDFFKEIRRYMGRLNISSSNGTPVDSIYEELNEMHPDMFPDDIYSPSDRMLRIMEVSDDLRKTETTLDTYYNTDELKGDLKYEFENAVNDFRNKLYEVKHFNDAIERAEVKPGAVIDAKSMQGVYDQLKAYQKEADKVMDKLLLTKDEKAVLEDMLSGKRNADNDVIPDKFNKSNIMKAYNALLPVRGMQNIIENHQKNVRNNRDATAMKMIENSDFWKDKKSGLAYMRETQERNVYDIVKNKEQADKIVETYFTPVHEHEAERTRFKHNYFDKVRDMDISRRVTKGNRNSESEAVQFLGEVQGEIEHLEQRLSKYNKGKVSDNANSSKSWIEKDREKLEELKRKKDDFVCANPNLDYGKIDEAIGEFRKIYNELFEMMNEVRIRNGYAPVEYRKNYFPHFMETGTDSLTGKIASALGINVDVTELPTDIAGRTENFKPGIAWVQYTKRRNTNETKYDAIEGFQKYIEGVSDVIFHTDDIQNLRAFERAIRYKHSEKGVKDAIDELRDRTGITDEEREELIGQAFERNITAFSNYVNNLTEYTNLLANKKSMYDRGMEKALNRKFYNLFNWINNRVASNMIVGNLSTAITNFIPLTQATAVVGSGNMLIGFNQTVKNTLYDDGMTERSTFLTNRFGQDKLISKSKVADKLSWAMEFVDEITSGTIWRARYHQNIKKGMSDADAIKDADRYAANLIADRSKGALPTVFGIKNPLVKAFTAFQVETNNQLSHLFKDIPEEAGKKLALVLFKYFLGAYLFNDVYEKVVGRRPALDPISWTNEFVGDLTGKQIPNSLDIISSLAKREKVDFSTTKLRNSEAITGLIENVAEDIPFVGGFLGGGRIPISSAFEGLKDVLQLGDAEVSGKKKAEIIHKNTVSGGLINIFMPYAGSQLAKTMKGAKAYLKGGSYRVNNEGEEELQYPVDTGFWSSAQSLTFGKSSTKGAQDWVEDGFGSLTSEQTELYKMIIEDKNTKRTDVFNAIKSVRDAKGVKEGDKSKTETQARHEALNNVKNLSDNQKGMIEYSFLDDGNKEKVDGLRNAKIEDKKIFELMYNLTDHDEVSRETKADKYYEMSKSGTKDVETYWNYEPNLTMIKRETLVEDKSLTKEQKQIIDDTFIGEGKIEYDYSNGIEGFYYSALTENQKKGYNKYIAERGKDAMDARSFYYAIKVMNSEKDGKGSKKIVKLQRLRDIGFSYAGSNRLYRYATMK